MNKILKIAHREYVATTRTKTFILGLAMVPLIIGGIILLTGRATKRKTGPRPPLSIAVTDLSKEVFAEAKNKSFYDYNKKNPNRQIQIHELPAGDDPNAAVEDGKAKLRQGRFHAYVVLDPNVLEDAGKIRIYTHKPKPSDIDAMWTIENLFRNAVINQRCKAQDISPELLGKLRNVPIQRVEIGTGKQQERVQSKGDTVANMMIPFIFMFFIYMGMVGTGQHMISSVIEEKGSRVMEVLLSAVSPFQLMAGKILGLVGVGLTIVALWGVGAYVAANRQGVSLDITTEMMIYLFVYYILGFLLLSAVFAGAGSICNTIKETQGLMMPIMMIFIVPLLAWLQLVQNPDGALARSLSFVPPLTPMVMVLRMSAGANFWPGEIAASIVVLAISVVATMWVAAKIFRTGILMYGKRPALREVFRWLRQN